MPAYRWDLLLTHATLATLDGDAPFGLVDDAALACADGRIAWLGPMAALPADARAERIDDLQGRVLTPGLVDCHTHLVFAGNRAHEFDMRLNGATYEQIARADGRLADAEREAAVALGCLQCGLTLVGYGAHAATLAATPNSSAA